MPRRTKEARREYYAQTRERQRAWYRARYQRNKEDIKLRVAQWQTENADKVRETRRKHDQILRRRAISILGDKCARCGFLDARAFQIDHKNGGGNQELRKLGHSRAIYLKVIRENGAGYQLLCANCNVIKMRMEEQWRN